MSTSVPAPSPTRPAWLDRLARQHTQQNKVVFLLEGETADLQPPLHPEGPYRPLPDFLLHEAFGPRRYALSFEPESGLQARDATTNELLERNLSAFNRQHGLQLRPEAPADPVTALALLEQLARDCLAAGDSLVILLPQAEALFPPGQDKETRRVLMASLFAFASEPIFVEGDFACLLLARDGGRLPDELCGHRRVETLRLPLPDNRQRLQYLRHRWHVSPEIGELLQMAEDHLARETVGLTLQQFEDVLSEALRNREPLTESVLAQFKTELNQQQAGSLLAHLPAQELPDWMADFARLHATRTLTQFILHGNIADLVRHEEASAREGERYLRLAEYLSSVLFSQHDVVMTYDRAAGIGFRTAAMEDDFFLNYYFEQVFERNREAYEEWLKKLRSTPYAFGVMERYIEAMLAEGKRVALLIDYAETLVPATPPAASLPDRALLVFFLKWARESQFQQGELTTVLLTDDLANLHPQLVRNPYTTALRLPYPGEEQRSAFIAHTQRRQPTLPEFLDMSPEVLARDTAGMTLVQLNTLLREITASKLHFSQAALTQRKKDIIESEAGGLLAFVETPHTLEDVAGHTAAKTHLREAATALRNGRGDVLPMGYLINGPVGTGKTFLVSSFAGEIGIPMVVLQNFRGQYVGQTEANLERVLRLLEAMAPVAVMIDEADAALGNRRGSGDSGVSARIFSMIASFMADTRHRGRIIWFLLTARPDLMPVDLKRQGRAEEHIALFYPDSTDEKRELLSVMLRKTGISALSAEDFPDDFFAGMPIGSGADMEAALTRAKFRAAAMGREEPDIALVEQTFADFRSSTAVEEVELQNLAAVMECSSRELLPEHYRNLSRTELTSRVQELKTRLEH